MISDSEKRIIIELSARYHIERVLLFGSGLDTSKASRNIDLGVEGLAPEDFFKYYGDLLMNLSKPVDLIDLSKSSKFVRLVKKEGVTIYG